MVSHSELKPLEALSKLVPNNSPKIAKNKNTYGRLQIFKTTVSNFKRSCGTIIPVCLQFIGSN